MTRQEGRGQGSGHWQNETDYMTLNDVMLIMEYACVHTLAASQKL